MEWFDTIKLFKFLFQNMTLELINQNQSPKHWVQSAKFKIQSPESSFYTVPNAFALLSFALLDVKIGG